jgi:hypothetical protein
MVEETCQSYLSFILIFNRWALTQKICNVLSFLKLLFGLTEYRTTPPSPLEENVAVNKNVCHQV